MARVRGSKVELAREHSSSFAAGYLESMLDITAEFETTVREHADVSEADGLAVREGWRDILFALAEGLRLPSEIADYLHEDRSRVTRVLGRLRAAGLAEVTPEDPLDGRMRPHRLTSNGRRALERLGRDDADGTVQGIRLAIALISMVMGRDATAISDLERVAFHILGDQDSAAQAVETWTQVFTDSGMMRDIRSGPNPTYERYTITTGKGSTPAIRVPVEQPANSNERTERPETRVSGNLPAQVSSDAPWQQVPRVLALVRQRADDPVPLYVRTNDSTWAAWAFTLGQDNVSQSRAIIDGDIITRAITPPQTRFRLLYDDPSALRADVHNPTMRALIDSADEKYLVAYPGSEFEDIPQGFVHIDMSDMSERS